MWAGDAADVEARLFLGSRRQSIFFTPVRAAVEAATHADATALSSQLTGSGISRQSHALAKKILEVEDWLPTAPCAVWEVHPEVSFALLIGRPARASKKTWAGMIERRQALAAAGINLDRAPHSVGRSRRRRRHARRRRGGLEHGATAGGNGALVSRPPHCGGFRPGYRHLGLRPGR